MNVMHDIKVSSNKLMHSVIEIRKRYFVMYKNSFHCAKRIKGYDHILVASFVVENKKQIASNGI